MTVSGANLTTSTQLVLGGWLAVGAFAAADVAQQGSKDLVYGLVLAGIATAVGRWVLSRRQGPPLVISLVLGGLITIAQVAYVLVDLTQDARPAHALVDGIALVGGLLLVVGAVRHFASR